MIASPSRWLHHHSTFGGGYDGSFGCPCEPPALTADDAALLAARTEMSSVLRFRRCIMDAGVRAQTSASWKVARANLDALEPVATDRNIMDCSMLSMIALRVCVTSLRYTSLCL